MPPVRIMLCLVLGTALAAAPRPYLGFGVHLDAPIGDLNTDLGGKLGGGASFQATFELGPALSVRPRADLDFQRVSHHRIPGTHHQEDVTFDSVGVGADLLGTLTGSRERGLYWTAGAGILRWYQSFNSSDYTSSTSSTSSDTRRNRLSPWGAVGLGYQVNHLIGLELRNVVSRYDSPKDVGLQAPFADVPSEARTASVLQAGVTFRW